MGWSTRGGVASLLLMLPAVLPAASAGGYMVSWETQTEVVRVAGSVSLGEVEIVPLDFGAESVDGVTVVVRFEGATQQPVPLLGQTYRLSVRDPSGRVVARDEAFGTEPLAVRTGGSPFPPERIVEAPSASDAVREIGGPVGEPGRGWRAEIETPPPTNPSVSGEEVRYDLRAEADGLRANAVKVVALRDSTLGGATDLFWIWTTLGLAGTAAFLAVRSRRKEKR